MARVMPIGEAAQALGVSLDTLRRWDREGRLQTERDGRGRRLVPVEELGLAPGVAAVATVKATSVMIARP